MKKDVEGRDKPDHDGFRANGSLWKGAETGEPPRKPCVCSPGVGGSHAGG